MTPKIKEEIMSVERSDGIVFPKKRNSTSRGLRKDSQQKSEMTIKMMIIKSRANMSIFYLFQASSGKGHNIWPQDGLLVVSS